MAFSRQVRALLWKTYKVKSTQKRQFCLEFLIPILISFMVVTIASTITEKTYAPSMFSLFRVIYFMHEFVKLLLTINEA